MRIRPGTYPGEEYLKRLMIMAKIHTYTHAYKHTNIYTLAHTYM